MLSIIPEIHVVAATGKEHLYIKHCAGSAPSQTLLMEMLHANRRWIVNTMSASIVVIATALIIIIKITTITTSSSSATTSILQPPPQQQQQPSTLLTSYPTQHYHQLCLIKIK